MGLSIKDTVKKTFTNDVVKRIATHVGENEGRVERGIATAVPAVLQNMSVAAETDEGLHALQTELDKADVEVLDSFERRFNETPNIIVERGRSLMKNLFGADEAKSTAARVASAAGIGSVSAEMVTGAVVPVVTGALAKHRKTAGLSVAGMRSALAAQYKETAAAGTAPGFPPGEAPVRETPTWTALLFPLLALVGLIVLGISLAGDGRGKSKADGEQLASNTTGSADAELSEHGKVDGGESGDSAQTAKQDGAGDGEVAKNRSTKHGAAGNIGGLTDVHDGGSSIVSTEHDGNAADGAGNTGEKSDGHVGGSKSSAHATGNAGGDGGHSGGHDSGAKKASAEQDGEAVGSVGGDEEKSDVHGSAEQDGAAGHAGEHSDDHDGGLSKAAAEHDREKSDGHSHEKDGHENGNRTPDDVADAGSKAAAAAGSSGTDFAVELPAAVSKATRILNAVDDVAGARSAIPKLNAVTDRLVKLRGDQKAWPDETQSLVRRRMFALMPALNEAVGKMLDKDEYLTTLEKPLTKFIGEIDLLVPER